MEKTWKIVIGAGTSLLIILLIILLTSTSHMKQQDVEYKEALNTTCLYDFAKDYCEHEVYKNKELEVAFLNEKQFHCYIQKDVRLGIYEYTRPYYFLPRELQQCTVIEVKGGDK